MRLSSRFLVSLSGSMALSLAANAVTPSPAASRYDQISERNVFDLRQPMPPPQPSVTTQGPPPQIVLTGITTMLGNKLALLKTLLPAKPGEPAKEQTLMLSEGQREANIEVLEINERARTVRVNDAGSVLTLTFEKNGPARLASPAPQTPGVVNLTPSAAPIPQPAPANSNLAPSAGNPAAGMSLMPTRVPRGAPSSPAPTVPSPTGPVPTPAPGPTQTGPQLTPEDQAALLELEQRLNPNNYPPSRTAAPTNLPGLLPPGANMQHPVPPLLPQ